MQGLRAPPWVTKDAGTVVMTMSSDHALYAAA